MCRRHLHRCVGLALAGVIGCGGGNSAGDRDAATADAGADGAVPGDLECPTTFRYRPADSVSQVAVAGEWHGFDLATATAMTSDGSGTFSATVNLAPGLHGYKLVADGDWRLDPAQGRRKYVGDPAIENSAIKVADCRLPSLSLGASSVARPAAGSGAYDASLSFVDGIEGSGPDAAGYQLALQRNGTDLVVGAGIDVDAGTGAVTISLTGLEDGKYRLTVTPRAQNGRVGLPLRLVFWVEAEPFSWQDALIYMVVTDRYRDGDDTNNPGPTANADPRGDWMGGDLQGVTASIADGTLDALGVRAIWLTPFQTNPAGAYLAQDNQHQVTGYHGYWPIKARQVEPRIGGEAALRALVAEAHAHGIRVLGDFVLNHVHQDHEYVTSHPDWFRTGCVCGSAGCDWTERALDCQFTDYLPDVDHTVAEATGQLVADAVWWMDSFGLDGLRVDAVKHVEEVATRNLAAEIRETFDLAGTPSFLMGETAMGWSDCADPCNDDNYGTISRYIGPHGLDGQFDFVLYHAVSYNTFASESHGMLHADYWVQHGLGKYPAGAIMTPYIGSHDTPRFVTLADPDNAGRAHNQWSNTATAPVQSLPYQRARLGFAWLLNLPGAPLLYYGDEYGQWGGADPNNRLMWQGPAGLSSDELATLSYVRQLATARKNVLALRRGSYVSLQVSEDTLVFARKLPSGQSAVIGLTRSSNPVAVNPEVATALGLGTGTTLADQLGGPSATVDGGGLLGFTIPAEGAVVLAP